MKDAYTTQELAEMLGTTGRSILRRAKREGWHSRIRKGQGGGHEWLLTSMPEVTRVAVAAKVCASAVLPAEGITSPSAGTAAPVAVPADERRRAPGRSGAATSLAALTGAAKRRADARIEATLAARIFATGSGLPYTVALDAFARQYNAGEISLSDATRAELPSLCMSSLRRWDASARTNGAAALAGNYGAHMRGRGCIDSQDTVVNTILGMLRQYPNASAAVILERLEAMAHKGVPLDVPSLRRLQSWIAGWKAKHRSLMAYVTAPDKWRGGYESATGISYEALTEYNERWEYDGTPADLMLADGKRYQRLMIVESVTSQDPLHYDLKLRNYTPRSWQYDDLPVPLWQGRGQLPAADELSAPDCFRARILSAASLVLTWLAVPGAQGYDIETSLDGQTWEARGRALVTQMTIEVPSGVIHARVRAVGAIASGPWAVWQGDTTVPAPARPSLALDGPYQGGQAVITWTPVPNADSYALALFVGDEPFYVTALGAETTTFTVSPELFQGSPARSFRATLEARGAAGASEEAALAINDPAPEAVTFVDATVAGGAVIFAEISPNDAADSTGYVLVRGNAPDFTAAGAQELRAVGSLPFTWAGLAPGRHYFRAAVRDAFYDATYNTLRATRPHSEPHDEPPGSKHC